MADNEKRAMFFGCWGKSGHYSSWPNGSSPSDLECEQLGFPCGHHLDGSYIFLPYPEVVGHGRVTYLAAPDISVMSWWNRVFDTRGKVNSHFMYRGHIEPHHMWHIFKMTFPVLAAAHVKPILAITY